MPPATLEEGVAVAEVPEAAPKLENGAAEHDTLQDDAAQLHAAKRSLREREQINYNEVQHTRALRASIHHVSQEALQRKIADLAAVDDSPPTKRSKHGSLARALQQVDHNTATERRTADSVNLPHNMLSDEEEGLLPEGANESLYIKVGSIRTWRPHNAHSQPRRFETRC